MMKRPGAATNAWNRRASTPVRSHEPEFQTAPDNGSPKEVLAYVLECARRWVPEARIIGNARAGDIERALATLSLPAGGVAVSDAMVERLVTMGWNACRKSLYAVCEDVIEEADRVRIKGPVGTFAEEQHCKGYHAGTCYAAKSISRGFNSMEAIDDDNVRKAIREAALSPEAKTGER